jgi:hypothetical protein
MTRTSLIIALAATAALAGCNEDHTIVAGGPGDDQANSAANAKVELPPSIAASKIYRCSGDNSVLYVDWLSDQKTANVRTEDGGRATQVVAAEAGKPLTSAGGMSLEGNAGGTAVKVTLPGGGSKSCHV